VACCHYRGDLDVFLRWLGDPFGALLQK
jgi:hypothetical protein